VISLPQIGFGTYKLQGEEGIVAIRTALETGYRILDTAAMYENEIEVGRAIRESGVPREEIIVTTKIRGRNQGFDEAQEACRESLRRLGFDYVDLLFIHWPNPRVNRYVDTWHAMVELKEDGLTAEIGVSNFTENTLTRIIDATGVTPAVNQIELHPYFPQTEMRALHAELGIVTESWSPLGRKSELLSEPLVAEIAAEHGVSVAQALLRWHIQIGSIPIPKSATPSRIAENFDVFGFELTDANMASIASLERGRIWDADPDEHEEM
jgi:2,5-diketo-D-gluconate reductase A